MTADVDKLTFLKAIVIYLITTQAYFGASAQNDVITLELPEYRSEYASSKYTDFETQLRKGVGTIKHPEFIEEPFFVVEGDVIWAKIRVVLRHLPVSRAKDLQIDVVSDSGEVVGSLDVPELLEDGSAEVHLDLARPAINYFEILVEAGDGFSGAVLSIELFHHLEAGEATSPIGSWDSKFLDQALQTGEVVQYRSRLIESSRSIGRLIIERPRHAKRWPKINRKTFTMCTGFLAQSDNVNMKNKLFVTNHHCVENAMDCRGASVLLNDKSRTAGAVESLEQRPYAAKCERVVYTNPLLDISILELDHDIPECLERDSRGMCEETTLEELSFDNFFELETNGRHNAISKKVALFHHPAGWTLQLAPPPSCRIVSDSLENGHSKLGKPEVVAPAIRNRDILHSCDTQGSSSGSPLLSWPSLGVLGIHYSGKYHLGSYPMRNSDHKKYNRAISVQSLRQCIQITNLIEFAGSQIASPAGSGDRSICRDEKHNLR